MIFGILVVFSEEYFIDSLSEFGRVLKLTARPYKIIVVFNNHDLAEKYPTESTKGINYDSVIGSNQFHEFSGWNEGLDFIKLQYASQYQKSHFVFCNDTFCQHRTYTFFHRLIFSASCTLSFFARNPTIAGEVNSFGEDFEFNNCTFSTWVSSYFFSINQSAINLLKFNILPSSNVINTYLVGGHEEKLFFSNSMDLKLKRHLLNWLFLGGWYKSESLNQINKDRFYCKARSILAEFNLSSNAHEKKIGLIDTYFLIKKFNKLRRSIYLHTIN